MYRNNVSQVFAGTSAEKKEAFDNDTIILATSRHQRNRPDRKILVPAGKKSSKPYIKLSSLKNRNAVKEKKLNIQRRPGKRSSSRAVADEEIVERLGSRNFYPDRSYVHKTDDSVFKGSLAKKRIAFKKGKIILASSLRGRKRKDRTTLVPAGRRSNKALIQLAALNMQKSREAKKN